jgi:alanine dehydrogenase
MSLSSFSRPAQTSTYALTNSTIPYALELADKGWERALLENQPLLRGLNVLKGALTNRKVAEALGKTFVPYKEG